VIEQVTFRWVALAGVVGVVVAVAVHYLVFGPHRVANGRAKADVRRFSIVERVIHGVTLLSFVTLGVTGLIAAIGHGARLTGWPWVVHAYAAPVFAVGLTCEVVMWAKDACLAAYDWRWLAYCGGYLGFGKDKGLVAGRFNAGQKVLLWLVAALGLAALASGLERMFPVAGPAAHDVVYQVHRYSTLGLMMAIIAHAYLGTLANPGTIGVVIRGRVSAEWARAHHAVWWDSMNKGPDK